MMNYLASFLEELSSLKRSIKWQSGNDLKIQELESITRMLKRELSYRRLTVQAIQIQAVHTLTKELITTLEARPTEVKKALSAYFHRKDLDSAVHSDFSALNFAVSHALHVLEGDAIYSFIPKNACSSMRYSIALSNGYINKPSQVEWLHDNNLALTVKSIALLINPGYSFVILRCPFVRLVSAFLDKFVKGERQAVGFAEMFLEDMSYGDITFEQFINALLDVKEDRRKLDEHWRHQVDFLLYEEYDRYFCMENFGEIPRTIKEDIGLSFKDARSIVGHDTSRSRKREDLGEPWRLTISQIRDLSSGGLPVDRAMYNKDLALKAHEIYKDDVELYSSKFGSDGLLFTF